MGETIHLMDKILVAVLVIGLIFIGSLIYIQTSYKNTLEDFCEEHGMLYGGKYGDLPTSSEYCYYSDKDTIYREPIVYVNKKVYFLGQGP